jgi:CBS domain-containing protein
MTQVSQVMTRGVRSMSPNDTMIKAAQAMEELDVGVIPVCEGDRLVGMVTDRDLVIRGLAQGRAAENTQLNDVMSADVHWCYDDQSVEEVIEQMPRRPDPARAGCRP